MHACNSLLGLQNIYITLKYSVVFNLFSTYKNDKYHTISVFFADLVFGRFQSASKLNRSNTQTCTAFHKHCYPVILKVHEKQMDLKEKVFGHKYSPHMNLTSCSGKNRFYFLFCGEIFVFEIRPEDWDRAIVPSHRHQLTAHCGLNSTYGTRPYLEQSQLFIQTWAGFFKQSVGARNRVGLGLSYRPARLHRLAEFIPWNRFLGSINV